MSVRFTDEKFPKLSGLGRCPVYRVSGLRRFDCSNENAITKSSVVTKRGENVVTKSGVVTKRGITDVFL